VDLSLSESEQFLAETVRSFVQRDATTERLVALRESSALGVDPKWQAAMADAGWLGMVIDPELGGSGATTMETAVLCEELGRGPVPGPFLASSILSALLLGAAAPSPARDALLTGIADGSAVIVPVLAPAGYGTSDLVLDTAAGVHAFVPSVDAATHVLLPVTGAGSDDVDLVVIPVDAPGITHRRLEGFLMWSYEVVVADTAVAGGVVLHAARGGIDAALARVNVLVAAYQVGTCQEVLERSIDYSSTRQQFAQPIGRFQRVQDHIVELLNALDAARWTTYEAIWRIDTGQDAIGAAHLAKAIASESHLTCTDQAHKVHGGMGVDPQYGLTLHTETARALYEFAGHPRWHKRHMADALGW
jgi:alkylation response protein AidB-like acyl-CoA dehydrogenase